MSYENALVGGVYGGNTACDVPKMGREATLQERLDIAVRQAEEHLKVVTEAREIFTRNPDLEKLLNLMQRGLF